MSLKSQLARALMFSGEARRAVAVSDEVLEAAERANLVPLIADALVTRGTALASAGRLYEGGGVIEAARQLAEAHGLTLTLLRALNNQGGLLGSTDPRRSLQIQRSMVELAGRTGSVALRINGTANAMSSALRVGEWGWALAAGRALLDEEMAPSDRATLLANWLVPAAGQGIDVASFMAEVELLSGTTTDPQSVAERESALAWCALAHGRDGEARDRWQRCLSAASGPAFAAYSALVARAALWARDLEAVRGALVALDESGAHGGALEAERVLIGAAIAGLEGRTAQAAADYRTGRRAIRDLGLAFDEALIGIDMVVALGPSDPDAREAAAESRRILDGLGAVAYLARLDALLTAVPADPLAAPASSPTAERERTAQGRSGTPNQSA